MDENTIYNEWIYLWRMSIIKNIIFLFLGTVSAIIAIGISRHQNISLLYDLFNLVPDFSNIVNAITGSVLTTNGIIIGFSSVSIFNFIRWSDDLLGNNLNEIDINSIHILRQAFSRFSRSYITWCFSTILLQIMFFTYSFISDLFILITLFFNFISLMIIYDGFKIILNIVLRRIEVGL